MNKISLLILVVAICNNTFSQGAFNVAASQNRTCNLDDNILIETLNVKIITTGNDEIKYFTFSDGTKYCYLKPGFYNIEITNNDGQIIILCNILIRNDDSLFINVLFEPKRSLTWKEKHKRKMYDNYKNNKCA